MTKRQQKIDKITDDMYYHLIELTSLASDLEEIGLDKDGDQLRSVADDIERLAIRLLNRKHSKRTKASDDK